MDVKILKFKKRLLVVYDMEFYLFLIEFIMCFEKVFSKFLDNILDSIFIQVTKKDKKLRGCKRKSYFVDELQNISKKCRKSNEKLESYLNFKVISSVILENESLFVI